jgi:peptidoglycan hydrolase CwlO-like protein
MTPETDLQNRITRILEIPKLFETVSRKLVGLRGDRRTIERLIEKTEASVRVQLVKHDIGYGSLKNQTDREAFYRDALEKNDVWTNAQNRHESLTAAIEKTTSERDTLEHERKALKAALEREYAAIIERLLTDKTLTEVIAKHGKVTA